MSESSRASRNERSPRYDREQGEAVWIVAAMGIALLVGLGVWEMAHRSHATKSMTSTPTPSASVSLPRPDETSGQAPRPARGRIMDPPPPR
jgi:hypothetical protein